MKSNNLYLMFVSAMFILLLISCSEDINNAEIKKIKNSKSMMKQKYTECSIYMGGISGFNQLNSDGRNAGFNFKVDDYDSSSINGDTVRFKYRLHSGGFPGYENYDSFVEIVLDFENMMIQNANFEFEWSKSQAAAQRTGHYGYENKIACNYTLKNLPFLIDKDSTIIVKTVGLDNNKYLANYYYEVYSSQTYETPYPPSHSESKWKTDSITIDKSNLIYIKLK
jgi:hypothetical protein